MKFKTTRIQPFGLLIEPLAHANVNQLDIEELRALFHEDHLMVLRGFQTFVDAEDFAHYCERWGKISVWPFGKVLELVEHENPEDHIFDNNYVPLHWDGMYRLQVPEYQIFHCVAAPGRGKGGRTTFSNTMLALKYARPEDVTAWRKVHGTYKRKMEFYDSKTVSPLITKHPYKGYEVIRYNEPPSLDIGDFVNPPELSFSGVQQSELPGLHAGLKEALYSPENFYAHEWRPGDVVIADNFSLLHGRESFESRSPRHIRRVHVLSDPPLDNPGLESYR